MIKDDPMAFVMLLGIIAIALFGGSQTGPGLFTTGPVTPEQKQYAIQQKIIESKYQVENLKEQIQLEEDKKNASEYKGQVSLSYVNRSKDTNQEYIVIRTNYNAKSVPITGWTLKSLNSGMSVQIPKADYLFFTTSKNSEENIYLGAGETVYLVTGRSPNGESFKVNKCSGYFGQFQTFIPYINNICPRPRDEDLSSIPNQVINDDCLDYIQYMPQCRIQTDPLPANWGRQCTDFIYKKINYGSCIDTHKNDADFYQPEWRVYLKRSDSIYKSSREYLVLYDSNGKVVDSLKY